MSSIWEEWEESENETNDSKNSMFNTGKEKKQQFHFSPFLLAAGTYSSEFTHNIFHSSYFDKIQCTLLAFYSIVMRTCLFFFFSSSLRFCTKNER